jgi:Spy/CpxP family protein refolding chaperone
MKRKSFLSSMLGVAGFLVAGTFAPAIFAQAAQDNPPAASQSEARTHEKGEGRFAGLNLTDDQKGQIQKIHQNAKAKADAVMSDTSLSDADKQAKVKRIHHMAMREASNVLTPEQREQMKAKRRERRAEHSSQPS